jgi:hypothetical protein
MTPTSLHFRVFMAVIAVYAALMLPTPRGRDGLYADNHRPTEYQVKAAYLANFAKFVEWPPGALPDDNPIPVCVAGQDPFGAALDAALSGESVGGHSLVAKRIGGMREVDGCRILFVSNQTLIDSAALAAERMPILTVSDSPDFLKRGGMIEFVLDSNRVRFEINLAAAKTAGLNLSSQLLRVATTVRNTP